MRKARPLRILCIHGVNHLESDPGKPPSPSEAPWRDGINKATSTWSLPFEVEFAAYNKLFDTARLTPAVLVTSVAKLTASAVWHGLGDVFGARGFGPQGGLGDTLEWTAGMICEWAGNAALRDRLRRCILVAIERARPDLVLAHSLGSLIAYDTLARPVNASAPGVEGLTLATFGSQIGHPAVRNVFGGRLRSIPPLRHWFHLYNPKDHVFTAPLDIRFASGQRPNFSQHLTPFDQEGNILNHDAGRYLAHEEATAALWRDVAAQQVPELASLRGFPPLPSARPRPVAAKASARARRDEAAPAIVHAKPAKRALLVGLSHYPNPAHDLPGCANDVFLMSQVLQKAGFAAQDIRVVLDARATKERILDRLHWLLDGAHDGHDRVFYFAGHGAQLPGYGAHEVVDRLDECLVPYDFDWSRTRAFVDDEFHDLYAQLPENTRFLTILDCCHSGGMARDGGVRARGLSMPDDLRHRVLEWSDNQFRERSIGPSRVAPDKGTPDTLDVRHGSLRKLGCSVRLRNVLGDAPSDPSAQRRSYILARKAFGHSGPFMPFILEACAEGELALEHRHGSQSNGAFTWFLAEALTAARRPLSWARLVQDVQQRMAANGYRQRPQLVCPTRLKDNKIPWPQASKA